jgi:hypothetical protein
MFLALVLAASQAFHLQLESNTASAFPLMKRFGTISIDVYPRGFRAKTIWLRGFAINGQNTITIENPVSRTYVKKPMSALGDVVRFIHPEPLDSGAPRSVQTIIGKVGRLPARRYRLVYGPNDYVDIWTSNSIGPAPALRAAIEEVVAAIAPGSRAILRTIPDTPVYVEMNMGEYRKLPVLTTRGVAFNSTGESEALRVSPWMFPAPFDTIFK